MLHSHGFVLPYDLLRSFAPSRRSVMTLTTSILAIAGALTLGAMSPGPSFVLVAKVAVTSSRKDALAAAIGMGTGGLILAVAAMAGLQALLAAVPVLYIVMKVAGGAYLMYLGWRIWRSARQPLLGDAKLDEGTRTLGRSFLLALTTQISNPKAAIVYGSVFAALLPGAIPWQAAAAICAIVFAIEAGWYAIVALALSSGRSRSAYSSYKAILDRIAGGVMAALGLKLVTSHTST